MSGIDYGVLAVYAGAVLVLGLAASRGRKTPDDLYIAGRRLPMWAVLCSMVSTELSAATFIGVPHAAYTGDWSYLQFAFGALAGKLLLAAWVMPLYHRRGLVTVYGLLGQTFGPRSQRAAALCFLVGRLLASGVRLFIAALAFAVVTGLPIGLAIAACAAVAGLYTLAGGIRAVVWTDVLQGAVFVAGALALVVAVSERAPGGAFEVLAWGAESGRTAVFTWSPLFAWGDTRPFGVALLGGFFLTLATHATDHDMVQRLLATRDGRSAGRALAGSALANFPLSALFLFIGTGIALAYAAPPAYDISDGARILPIFALHELPAGLRGLLFAGLFAAAMSSLDSATCALATTWTVDVAPPARGSEASVGRIRAATAIFCALLAGSALAMASYHAALGEIASDGRPVLNLVELALSAMTVLYGGLLGVFGVALLTASRGSDASALAGLSVGAAAGAALFLHPILLGSVWIAWPWWIPISGTLAFAVATLAPRTDAGA